MASGAVKPVCLALLCVLGMSPGGWARSPGQDLERARQLYQQLRYPEVVPALEKALSSAGDDQKLLGEIWRLMGIVHVILENEPEASRAFRRFLTLQPDGKLDPDLSPKILDFFERVRKDFIPALKVSFAGPPAIQVQPDGTIRIESSLHKQGSVEVGVAISYRYGGKGAFQRRNMTLTRSGTFRVDLRFATDRLPHQGWKLEYFLTVVNARGGVLAVHGNRDRPQLVSFVSPRKAPRPAPTPGVAPPPPPRSAVVPAPVEVATPWYEKWWVWSIVGVVVAGAAVGLALAIDPGFGLPSSTLGDIVLED